MMDAEFLDLLVDAFYEESESLWERFGKEATDKDQLAFRAEILSDIAGALQVAHGRLTGQPLK